MRRTFAQAYQTAATRLPCKACLPTGYKESFPTSYKERGWRGLGAMQQPMIYLGQPPNGAPAPTIMQLWQQSPEYRKGVWIGAGVVGVAWAAAFFFMR